MNFSGQNAIQALLAAMLGQVNAHQQGKAAALKAEQDKARMNKPQIIQGKDGAIYLFDPATQSLKPMEQPPSTEKPINAGGNVLIPFSPEQAQTGLDQGIQNATESDPGTATAPGAGYYDKIAQMIQQAQGERNTGYKQIVTAPEKGQSIGAGGLKNPDGTITPPFVKPTPEETPAQRSKRLLDDIRRNQIEKGGGKIKDWRLSADGKTQYRTNPQTGEMETQPAPDTLSKPKKPIPAAENEKLSLMGQAIKGLDDLEKQLSDKEVADSIGPVMGKIGITAVKSAYNPKVATFLQNSNLTGQLIARMFERGVISNADRDFYVSLLPNKSSDPTVALANLKQLRERLKGVQADRLQSFQGQGFTTEGFEGGSAAPALTPAVPDSIEAIDRRLEEIQRRKAELQGTK